MSILYVLKNGPYVLVIQLFPSQSCRIPAGCGYSHNSLYLLDIYQHLDLVYSSTMAIPLLPSVSQVLWLSTHVTSYD